MGYSQHFIAYWFSVVAVSCVVVISPAVISANDCPGAASEGWDSGVVNGWQGGVGTTITVIGTGGHPGGYLSGEHTGPVMIMSSEAPFSGDYAAGGIREILVDIQLFSGTDVTGPFIRLRDHAGTNGWYYDFADTLIPDGLWHTYVVPVDSTWDDQQAQDAGWVAMDVPIDVTFADTLASVGYLIIWVDLSYNDEIVGFDNVSLACCLFADDFESEDFSAWSAVIN